MCESDLIHVNKQTIQSDMAAQVTVTPNQILLCDDRTPLPHTHSVNSDSVDETEIPESIVTLPSLASVSRLCC